MFLLLSCFLTIKLVLYKSVVECLMLVDRGELGNLTVDSINRKLIVNRFRFCGLLTFIKLVIVGFDFRH